MNRIKKIVLGALVMSLIAGSIVLFQYNKPHKDYTSQEASIQISSVELFSDFSESENEANKKYLDKVMEVTGVILEITVSDESSMLVLESEDDFFGVNVYLAEKTNLESYNTGDQIKIKGRCTGGNSMGVILNSGTIIK